MLSVSPKINSLLQQLPQFVGGQLAIPEDSVKQTGTDGLTRVHRHNRAPAILVTQEVMATFNAKREILPFRGRQ